MRNSAYLEFIRNRPCAFCAGQPVDPHHALKRLRGISAAGLGQKGNDLLGIPACRRCHEQIHARKLRPSREEILELIVTCLVCFLDEK